MIYYQTGSIFDSGAQALVNPVNCKGVMGAGLALEFRQRYPTMLKAYRAACQSGVLRPGRCHFFQTEGQLIINFPTKDDWTQPSKLEYIVSGLTDLTAQPLPPTLAIPALGCGRGGLQWSAVEPLILAAFADLPHPTVYLYPPK